MASGVASRKLFSYVVAHDSGFAPCPYGRYCTLAYCKPDIRKSAKEGDWVVGTGSKRNDTSRKLVYAMEVTKIVPFQKYREGKKYRGRKDNKNYLKKHPKKEQRKTDRNGKSVLVSNNFYYFGEKAIPLENGFQKLINKSRKHKTFDDERLIEKFIARLKKRCHKKGKLGDPQKKEKNQTAQIACRAKPAANSAVEIFKYF